MLTLAWLSTLRILRALLARIPVKAWLLLAAILALVVGGYTLYRHGLTAGEVRVHRMALADSTTQATAAVDTATAHSNTVVQVAHKARAVSASTRAARERARTAALAEIAATQTTLPAIQHLIAVDDTLSHRDSVTIAVQAGAIDTQSAERTTRQALDSLRLHQLTVGIPASASHRTRYVVGGLVVAASVLALLHFVQ